jgi:uroporphyrinogen decarboxylase
MKQNSGIERNLDEDELSPHLVKNRKPLLRALAGEVAPVPPVWLMRQAGRYLPEYRAIRKDVGGFLDLCFTPELAIEVTLQPIRRFAFDAAIVFSDILVVPYALGQKVWFEEGRGPCLEPLAGPQDLGRLSLEKFHEGLAPVYETLRGLSAVLPDQVTLIGFAGAPWTVASYMLEGGSSRDFIVAKTFAYQNPEGFARLIDLLVEATADYLIRQVESGAEALQIFDSWAGVWPRDELRRWCLEPCKAIIAKVKAVHPEVPIIVFPRGVGPLYRIFAEESGAQAVSLDTQVPLDWARENLPKNIALQGNIDPVLLRAGGPLLAERTQEILRTLEGRPFVFNLGHGILPDTPISHVESLIESVRS